MESGHTHSDLVTVNVLDSKAHREDRAQAAQDDPPPPLAEPTNPSERTGHSRSGSRLDGRSRQIALAGILALASILVAEYLPSLGLGFAGDDFELIALARIGGFHPAALLIPHRSFFVKPVMSAAWALFTALFGARPPAWYGLSFGVHLLNAALLGFLAARLSALWTKRTSTSENLSSGGDAHCDILTGLSAATLWSVHDRLAEPLFSISSLNHSLTFLFYLVALHACLRALRTGAVLDKLALFLTTLVALFSYEVAASLVPTAVALALFDPAPPWRERARRVGYSLGMASLLYAAAQVLARSAPGATSYYRFSIATAMRNASEIGFAFLHVPSSLVAPGPIPALALAACLLLLFVIVEDRVVRFGIVFSAAAYLPLAAIPEFSDRYHYIAFAGLSLALGRGIALAFTRTRTRRTAPSRTTMPAPDGSPGQSLRLHARMSPWASVATALLLAHLVCSLGGAREQAAYYAFKSKLPARLRADASSGLSASPESSIVVLAWGDDPSFNANTLVRFEAEKMSHLFGERSHPIYVRPDAILGAVYPADLMTIEGAELGAFYRTPSPDEAVHAILENRAHVIPLAMTASEGREKAAEALAAPLRAHLIARREIPVRLSAEESPGTGPLRLAYFERTDRAGAFAAEYVHSPGK